MGANKIDIIGCNEHVISKNLKVTDIVSLDERALSNQKSSLSVSILIFLLKYANSKDNCMTQ